MNGTKGSICCRIKLSLSRCIVLGLQVTFQAFVPTCVCMICYLCLVMRRYIAESTVLTFWCKTTSMLPDLFASQWHSKHEYNMCPMLYNIEYSLCVNRPNDFFSLLCAQYLKLLYVYKECEEFKRMDLIYCMAVDRKVQIFLVLFSLQVPCRLLMPWPNLDSKWSHRRSRSEMQCVCVADLHKSNVIWLWDSRDSAQNWNMPICLRNLLNHAFAAWL